MAGVPDDLTMPSLITEKELAFYVKEFKKSGFRLVTHNMYTYTDASEWENVYEPIPTFYKMCSKVRREPFNCFNRGFI